MSLVEPHQTPIWLDNTCQNISTRQHVTDSMAAPVNSVGKPSAERPPFNSTSFQKKTRSKLISIPGTRPSVQNGQLLVSTGVTSLDYLLGQSIIRMLATKASSTSQSNFRMLDFTLLQRTVFILSMQWEWEEKPLY